MVGGVRGTGAFNKIQFYLATVDGLDDAKPRLADIGRNVRNWYHEASLSDRYELPNNYAMDPKGQLPVLCVAHLEPVGRQTTARLVDSSGRIEHRQALLY